MSENVKLGRPSCGPVISASLSSSCGVMRTPVSVAVNSSRRSCSSGRWNSSIRAARRRIAGSSAVNRLVHRKIRRRPLS